MALTLKNPPAKAGDVRNRGLITGSGRSPGGGHGNPLQHSCLENPMDRGASRATVHGLQSWTRLKWLSTEQYSTLYIHTIYMCICIYIYIYILCVYIKYMLCSEVLRQSLCYIYKYIVCIYIVHIYMYIYIIFLLILLNIYGILVFFSKYNCQISHNTFEQKIKSYV